MSTSDTIDNLRADLARERAAREKAEARAAALEAAFRRLLAIYESDAEVSPRPDWITAALSDPAAALAAHDARVKADAKADALRAAEAVCRVKAAVISKRNDAFGIKYEQSESATLDCADAIAALAGKGAGG